MLVQHEPELVRVELGDRSGRHEATDQMEDDVDPAEPLGDGPDRGQAASAWRRSPVAATQRSSGIAAPAATSASRPASVPTRPSRWPSAPNAAAATRPRLPVAPVISTTRSAEPSPRGRSLTASG